MGKIQILTKNQQALLHLVAGNGYLRDRFYFTGGTALSAYYLKHRYSDDLDFFSESEVETVPLKLEELKQFFRRKAKQLSKAAVK